MVSDFLDVHARGLAMSTDPSQPPADPDQPDAERSRSEPSEGDASSQRSSGLPGHRRSPQDERFARRQKMMSDYSRYATVGLQFGLYLTLCILGGYWLDRKIGTSPLLLILGVLVGFGTGLYSLMRKFPISPRRKAKTLSNQDDPPPAT